MNQPDLFAQIYFSVLSISTIAVGGLVVLCLMYIISILHDIKRLSKLAKKEAELLAKNFEKGVGLFGHELSGEAAGFLKTVFTLLLTQFGRNKSTRVKKERIKSI
jgi:hypothetical protein